MNLVEYKDVALKRLNKTIFGDHKESMNYSCMGLIEETGEIIAELRKPLFKGNFHEKTLDIENIKSELGDLIWYIALICNEEYDLLPKREQIIKVSLEMGKATGIIVEECKNNMDNINENNDELINEIREQYKNVNKLASLLDITIEQILEENIKKINSRNAE